MELYLISLFNIFNLSYNGEESEAVYLKLIQYCMSKNFFKRKHTDRNIFCPESMSQFGQFMGGIQTSLGPSCIL